MDENKVNRFKFRVPFSNPVYFGKVAAGGYEYRVWDDTLANEQYRQYTQRWHPGDRLSFQFSWNNLAVSNNANIAIRFYVNGTLSRTISYTIGNALSQGTPYTDFIEQGRGENPTLNGCYCFSQIISQIEDGDGRQLLNDGDCFYIEVTDPTHTVWRSNSMSITTDISGTKLIHYSNSSSNVQTIFDTYFGYMPYGYDLRIEGDFTELTPNTAASVFQDYNGGYTMISAVPFETIKLSIGDNGVRIPRYMLRTLNTVFACDKKSVDGIGFEMTGENLTVDRVAGYANDVYSVVVARSDNAFSYDSEGLNKFNVFVQPNKTTNLANVQSGTLTVVSSENWYMSGESVKLSGIKFEKISGGAGTVIIRYEMPRNYTQEDIVKTISFVSQQNGNSLGSADIRSVREAQKGLGYMKIGDTFVIS